MKKIDIPNMEPMYEQVRDAIKEMQGDKGYVSTGDWQVWLYEFAGYGSTLEERRIKAIKVDERGEILILAFLDDGDIEEAQEDDWWLLWGDEYVYFIPTLFRIAEAINYQII